MPPELERPPARVVVAMEQFFVEGHLDSWATGYGQFRFRLTCGVLHSAARTDEHEREHGHGHPGIDDDVADGRVHRPPGE